MGAARSVSDIPESRRRDAELAARCKALDPVDQDAWRELWNRNQRLIHIFLARGLLNREGDAVVEEIVVETFGRLFAAIRNYKPAASNLSTFLHTVASRTAIDYLRRKGRRVAEESVPDGTAAEPSTTIGESMLPELVQRVRSELAPPPRPKDRPIFDDLLSGLDVKEIAERQGVTEKVVRRIREEVLKRARDLTAEVLPDF